MQKVLKELFDQFVKKNGREPDNLEMILIRQKASAEEIRKRKIISMFDRSPVDADQPILGGQNIQETDAQILERLNKGNKESISNIKYENAVKAEEAKAAADEDYIMQVLDPEDFSEGGRAGYVEGGPIHSRLGELSSGVSSAEEQLQQINQSLQTAETSLGESGPGGAGSVTPSVNGYESSGSSLYNESPAGEVSNPYQAPVGMDPIKSPMPGIPVNQGGIDPGTNPYDNGGGLGGLLGEGGGNTSAPLDRETDMMQNDPRFQNIQTSGQQKTILSELPFMGKIDEINNPSYTAPQLQGQLQSSGGGLGGLLGGGESSGPVYYINGNTGKKIYDTPGAKQPPPSNFTPEQLNFMQMTLRGPGSMDSKKENPTGPIQSLGQGGRAGYYGGGQAMVGEDMSDIGHGSDALMARNMQIAPGGQATTSTGLNYLLGQDNDTARVPYKDAGPVVLPKEKPTNDFKNLLKIYNTYKDSMPGVSEDTQKYLAQDFINKLNEKGLSQTQFQTLRMQNHYEESKADGGRIGFKGGGADMGDEDKAEERTSKGYGIAPDTGSRKGTNDYSTTTQTQNHDRAMRDNQQPPKSTYEKTITAVQKANDLNKVYQVAKAGSLKPLFAINPYAIGITGLIALDKKRKQKQAYEDSLLEEETLMPYAEGGPARQNFKMGKRAFLKLMGGFGAGIASLKTGLLDFTKGGGKKVAKEVVKEATGAPPAYFFKLVDKIKKLGDDAPKLAVKDKENVTTYKDYTLTEDITTGEQTIQRMKIDDDLKYDASEYYGKPVGEEVYMSYRPGKGQMDETTKGKTPPDEYTEDTSLIRSDRPAEGEVMETVSGVPDDIFLEVGEEIPEIIRKEKADGGRIGYAGGKKVVEEIIKKANKKLGKKSVTTADKAEIPKETLLRDMFTDTNKRLNKKREMTVDEYEDFVEEVGGADQLEAYNFDGTVGDAERILKEQENRMKYMYDQYKMGKLDPVAGDKSPARKRFLEKKMEEHLMSGDSKLMTREEIDELYNFDLGTEMDKMKKIKIDEDIDISQGMIDLDEMNFTKNAQAAKNKMDNMDVNQKIKEGVASIMSDTSPAALEKSIEIDNLMLKYPGMDKNLAEHIASSPPTMKSDMIAMVEQTFKMDEMGMSGDDIIQTFKNTTRTKQATGGLASILG